MIDFTFDNSPLIRERLLSHAVSSELLESLCTNDQLREALRQCALSGDIAAVRAIVQNVLATTAASGLSPRAKA